MTTHDPPDLLAELRWRGLVEDQTPGLADRLAQGPVIGYVGFDPTARSLQIGNLVPLMLLVHLQRAGGKPIVVLGGGTGLIGDPSGKRAERPLLDRREVEENVERQRKQFELFLDFGEGDADAELVDNVEWLDSLDLVGFLRDIGKHFTLSYMLQKESVKSRLEEGISYTEFSYMLLQAYDFLQLYRTRSCELQLGGSDQWGNITAGRELVRRVEGAEVHGLSAPLLTTATGEKFGKSEDGTVWLDKSFTPVYTFYNYWVNVDDRDVESYLRMLTLFPSEQIKGLMEEHHADPGGRIPHRALAMEITRIVHGEDEARTAERETRAIFEKRRRGELHSDHLKKLLRTVPTKTIKWRRADPPTVEDLFVASGLAKSKSEVRRLVRQGGAYVNENVDGVPVVGDPLPESTVMQVEGQSYVLVRKGKKSYVVLLVDFV